jgi:hypothetical protein
MRTEKLILSLYDKRDRLKHRITHSKDFRKAKRLEGKLNHVITKINELRSIKLMKN